MLCRFVAICSRAVSTVYNSCRQFLATRTRQGHRICRLVSLRVRTLPPHRRTEALGPSRSARTASTAPRADRGLNRYRRPAEACDQKRPCPRSAPLNMRPQGWPRHPPRSGIAGEHKKKPRLGTGASDEGCSLYCGVPRHAKRPRRYHLVVPSQSKVRRAPRHARSTAAATGARPADPATPASHAAAAAQRIHTAIMLDVPPIFALRRISGDRWELVGPDDDPRRPSWRRWGVIDQGAGARSRSAISTLVCPPSTDSRTRTRSRPGMACTTPL